MHQRTSPFGSELDLHPSPDAKNQVSVVWAGRTNLSGTSETGSWLQLVLPIHQPGAFRMGHARDVGIGLFMLRHHLIQSSRRASEGNLGY